MDRPADDDLLPLVYHELRGLARAYLRRERADHTLQPTALVNEAWMRLARADALPSTDRAAYVRLAARAMRRVLVNHARDRGRLKRGGGASRTALDVEPAEVGADAIDTLALDEVLSRLEAVDARKAEVVQLRFFAGLTIDEVAETLGLSRAQIKRDWAFARAWLHDALHAEPPETPP